MFFLDQAQNIGVVVIFPVDLAGSFHVPSVAITGVCVVLVGNGVVMAFLLVLEKLLIRDCSMFRLECVGTTLAGKFKLQYFRVSFPHRHGGCLVLVMCLFWFLWFIFPQEVLTVHWWCPQSLFTKKLWSLVMHMWTHWLQDLVRFWKVQELQVAGHPLSLEKLEAFGSQGLEVLGREFV